MSQSIQELLLPQQRLSLADMVAISNIASLTHLECSVLMPTNDETAGILAGTMDPLVRNPHLLNLTVAAARCNILGAFGGCKLHEVFPRLQSLELAGACQPTHDAAFEQLAGLTCLTRLEAPAALITMAHEACMKGSAKPVSLNQAPLLPGVRHLALHDLPSDIDLPAVGHLMHLELASCTVRDAQFEALLGLYPLLRTVVLDSCPHVTDAAALALCRLPGVRAIVLREMCGISSAGVQALAAAKSVESIRYEQGKLPGSSGINKALARRIQAAEGQQRTLDLDFQVAADQEELISRPPQDPPLERSASWFV